MIWTWQDVLHRNMWHNVTHKSTMSLHYVHGSECIFDVVEWSNSQVNWKLEICRHQFVQRCQRIVKACNKAITVHYSMLTRCTAGWLTWRASDMWKLHSSNSSCFPPNPSGPWEFQDCTELSFYVPLTQKDHFKDVLLLQSLITALKELNTTERNKVCTNKPKDAITQQAY